MSACSLDIVLLLCCVGLLTIDHRDCSVDNLSGCNDTNELVRSPAFDAAIADFIGALPAGWLYKDGTMLGQITDVLGGPPDKPVYFSSSLVRFSACRHHSCDEKGALILTESGDIKAVGVIHFDVSRNFSSNPMLTIIIRNKGEQFQEIANHLFSWYISVINNRNKRKIGKYKHIEKLDNLEKIKDIEIIILNNL